MLFWVISILFFQVTQSSFLEHPHSQVVQLGSNVSLTCRFSMPSALVFFEHNSTVITPLDTDTFFFQYTGANATLFLRNVALLHTGTYLCRAAISATNHVLSAEATISIATAPTISSNQIAAGSINTFDAGSQFRIQFVFNGNPEPTFILLELSQTGGLFVEEGQANDRVFIWSGSELRVEAPLPQFSGFYRVQASNEFGVEEFDFSLQFPAPESYGISRISIYPEKDFFSSGERLTLSCLSEQQNVIGSWYRRTDNGDLIANIPETRTTHNNGNLSLEFYNLSRTHSGTYVCRLMSSVNRLQVAEQQRDITVFEDLSDKVPRRMDTPVFSFGDSWIAVNWSEPESPKPITTYHLNITVVSGDNNKVQTVEKDFPSELNSFNQTELIYLELGFLHIIGITASNQFGRGQSSVPIYLELNLTEPVRLLDLAPIIGGSLAAVLVLIGSLSLLCYLVCFRCYIRRSRSNEFKQRENLDEMDMSEKGTMKIKKYNDDPNGYIVTNLPPSYEVLRDGVELQDVVEETTAATCYRATIESIPGKLEHGAFAKVKLLKGNATNLDLKALISEMELMATIGCHTNVIGFLGACTTEPLYVITEYLPFGDLLSYLRASRGNHVSNNITSPSRVPYFNAAPSLTPADLLSFAIQIASGMKFLTSKHVVHSKLCAKNIMVGEDKMIKIDCYGQYKRATPNNTPLRQPETEDDVMVKWCAPESYFERVYSHKSDVWSYGVLLWEIVTIGATPYPGVKPNELYTILSTGYRMEKPQQCPHELYLLMLDTWMAHPDQRPTFPEVHDRINKIIRGSTLGDEKYSSETSLTDSGIRNFRL